MAGILDAAGNNGGGGGLLPFDARWEDLMRALGDQQLRSQMPAAFPPAATAPPMNTMPASLPTQQPQPMAAPLAPSAYQPSAPMLGIGDRLQAGLLGFANAGGPLPAIANLISGLATGERSDPAGMQQQSQLATYKALLQSGVPEPQARAGALNPEILKTITPEYFGGYKPVTVGEGPLGKQIAIQGPGGKFFEVGEGGRLVPFGTGAGGGGVSASALLAPGVTKLDTTLTGDAQLDQYSKDVQGIVRAMQKGDVIPTGNPRLQGLIPFAKNLALKISSEGGTSYSDALFSEKRKYRTELGSTSPTTVGGQSKAFVQGIEHADDLAKTLEKLGNWGGFGIPILAQGENMLRQALSTKQADIATKAQGIGQTLAGEVGKLFSGSAGGGVHERELTRNRFNTVKSPPELAGALEATIDTMEGGLRALEARRDQILGPNNDVKFVGPETEAKIASIRQVIARLRGEGAPAAAPAAPSAPAAPGPAATIPAIGQRKSGQVYQTPRGPMIWRGTGWEPASDANSL